MIKLGEKVRDKVTGFEGIAVQKIEYLNGCIQYAVKPKVKKGATEYPEGICIDEEQLERVNSGVEKCQDVFITWFSVETQTWVEEEKYGFRHW